MPNNDLTRDNYNPPGINSDDWERFQFYDLGERELFWLNQTRNDNPAFRKETENTAMNTITREMVTFNPKHTIYVKI